MTTNLTTLIRTNETKASHHPFPTRLSDNAFYLIVLASLLQKTIGPVQLQKFIAPVVLNHENSGKE